MNLYLLRPIRAKRIENEEPDDAWAPWYDKTFGAVIRADNEQQAREIMSDPNNHIFGDEVRDGGDVWLDGGQSTCILITGEGPHGLVITDFNAA